MKPSYIKNTLSKTISSMENDISSFVKHPGIDFSRKRCFSFSYLISFLLTLENHSLNRELRRFFSAKHVYIPTKSALVQQRSKLKEEAFCHLLSAMNQAFPFRKTFKGYHLLACDGSDINIPPLKDDDETRVPSNTPGVVYHQMHLNTLYDILEDRFADILIQPRACIDERAAFLSSLSD